MATPRPARRAAAGGPAGGVFSWEGPPPVGAARLPTGARPRAAPEPSNCRPRAQGTLPTTGTGLGLYLVKQCLDAMGCKISVTSAVGKVSVQSPGAGDKAGCPEGWQRGGCAAGRPRATPAGGGVGVS